MCVWSRKSGLIVSLYYWSKLSVGKGASLYDMTFLYSITLSKSGFRKHIVWTQKEKI